MQHARIRQWDRQCDGQTWAVREPQRREPQQRGRAWQAPLFQMVC